jgi:hypothetical protein
MKQRFASLMMLLFCCALVTASAQVKGTLNVSNCAGGAVTVTGTSIDWILPVGGGTGCVQADTLTAVTFAGGNIAPTELGTLKDLIFGVTPGTGFMVFSGAPGVGTLSFDLTALGPGVATTCTAGMAVGDSCSVGGSGPFLLTRSSTGTLITLTANGTVSDGTTPTSTWLGSFTTQFAGLAPIDIQNFILGISGGPAGLGCVLGSCTSTYSASFAVTVNPTPPGGCPATKGFWHDPSLHGWPDFSVTVGGVTYEGAPLRGMIIGGQHYTQQQLLSLMPSAPANGNGFVITGSQLIAAVLNIAAGAQHSSSVDAAIKAANDLLAADGRMVGTAYGVGLLVNPAPANNDALKAASTDLNNYNSAVGLGCNEASGLTLGTQPQPQN